MTAARSKRIAFLFTPDYALMSAAAAVEPFRAANLLSGRALYDLRFISIAGGAAASSVQATFPTLHADTAVEAYDVLFVISGTNAFEMTDPRLAAFIRAIARRGAALGGISGGAAPLAAAGVMAGRRFTIHWVQVDALRARYPEALIERRLFVIDRDRYTCAGGTAPLDMMHALIERDHGAKLARAVSDWFIHTGIRDAEAAPQLDPVAQYAVHHPALVAMISLMANHIGDPLALDDLAALSGVSTRQLGRLAHQYLGMSAMRFYQQMRLEKADEILRHSSLPIDAVAQATGFANRSHFSRAFARAYGIGPAGRRMG